MNTGERIVEQRQRVARAQEHVAAKLHRVQNYLLNTHPKDFGPAKWQAVYQVDRIRREIKYMPWYQWNEHLSSSTKV